MAASVAKPLGNKRQICLRDLSNQREMKLPESPVMKLSMLTQSASISPLALDISPTSSNHHLTLGCNSPPSRVNEEVSSAKMPSQYDSESNLAQQLQQPFPLAGSTRQLSKLKRFLMTLQQFGSDISPEIGERVRTLVTALINSRISIEDFHTKLQEATNFPLRPFVVPFLKANLPFLQRELLQSSPLTKHSLLGYPSAFLNGSSLLLSSPKNVTSPEINVNGKRPSPDRTKENGVDCPSTKRLHTVSPSAAAKPTSYVGHQIGGIHFTDDFRLAHDVFERDHGDQTSEHRNMKRDRLKRLDNYNFQPTLDHSLHHSDQEDWQFVESMLNNIIILVDRCKRMLESLEERNRHWEETAASFLHLHPKLIDNDYRRCMPNTKPNYGHSGDEQLSQVHRRTEEAIQEVRMQAVLELQQAIAAAKVKASHMVAAERAKMELAILEARKQAQEEILAVLGQQEKSSENCWNCGRKANETCSGCHTARYCGSYCQHKDWENHHRVCGSKASTLPSTADRAQIEDDTNNDPVNDSENRPFSRKSATTPLSLGSEPAPSGKSEPGDFVKDKGIKIE